MREEKTRLEEQLYRMQRQMDEEGVEFLNEYEQVKLEYETYQNHVTHGIIVRSRANWVEYGEENNNFFLNLEKINKARTSILKLKV